VLELRVSVAVEVPPVRVTVAGLSPAARPLEAETCRETFPEKPLRELTVTVVELATLGARAMLELLVTVKSWTVNVTVAE
jgi:hypothetical protein